HPSAQQQELEEEVQQLREKNDSLEAELHDALEQAQLAAQHEEMVRKLNDITDKHNALKEESQQVAQKMREEMAATHTENTRLVNENKHLLAHIESSEQREIAEALEAAR